MIEGWTRNGWSRRKNEEQDIQESQIVYIGYHTGYFTNIEKFNKNKKLLKLKTHLSLNLSIKPLKFRFKLSKHF